MGLLWPGAVELVLAGKAYNKAMRAHGLTLQALWRLLMPSLLSFVAEADADCRACLSRMAADDDSQTIPELITCLDQDNFSKLLAQRDGIWELHLYSFSLMLPYFKRCDHLDYARWGPVYLVEMHQLPEPVLSEFKRGNFVVNGSAHMFSQVDPDQAMEWIWHRKERRWYHWNYQDDISAVQVDTLL